MSKSKGRIPVNCNWQDMTGGQVVYASLPMTLGSKQLHNDYTLKGKKNDRWNGKQFGTIPAKAPGGMFAGRFQENPYNITKKNGDMTSDVYLDRYAKPKGVTYKDNAFGSKDPANRSEFTLTRRTEQYREQLKAEKQLLDKRARDQKAKNGPETEAKEEKKVRKLTLYDQVTRGWAEPMEVGKKKNLHPAGRNLGTYRITSSEVGLSCDDPKIIAAQKSRNGSKNVTDDMFDKGHLHVGRH